MAERPNGVDRREPEPGRGEPGPVEPGPAKPREVTEPGPLAPEDPAPDLDRIQPGEGPGESPGE